MDPPQIYNKQKHHTLPDPALHKRGRYLLDRAYAYARARVNCARTQLGMCSAFWLYIEARYTIMILAFNHIDYTEEK